MESDKQSAMQSPVSIATANSDLFARYLTLVGEDSEDADMVNGTLKNSTRQQRQYLMMVSLQLGVRKKNWPHMSHQTILLFFHYSFLKYTTWICWH